MLLLGAVAFAVAVAIAFAVAVAVTVIFRLFLAGRSSFVPRKHNLIFFSALVTTSLIEFSDQSDGTAWLNWFEIIFRHGKPVL